MANLIKSRESSKFHDKIINDTTEKFDEEEWITQYFHPAWTKIPLTSWMAWGPSACPRAWWPVLWWPSMPPAPTHSPCASTTPPRSWTTRMFDTWCDKNPPSPRSPHCQYTISGPQCVPWDKGYWESVDCQGVNKGKFLYPFLYLHSTTGASPGIESYMNFCLSVLLSNLYSRHAV